MRILDRYLIREIVPPFLLALAIFTFALAINPMLDYAEGFLAKGVPVQTVGFLLLTLLPQALGITIPMAFMTGLLIALGRMSGDRESVALLACGVSPAQLVRPVLLLGVVTGGLTMYVLMKAVPDSNQAFREATFRLLAEQSENDIKPRVFFERFPNMVLYVRDARPGGGWAGVMLADTAEPGRPAITMAETGTLSVDRERRLVHIVLGQVAQYAPGKDGARVYSTSRHDSLSIKISAESVFGPGDIARGLPEMRPADLRREIAKKRQAGISPHNEIMHFHQMYSFPVACVVFSIIGLALGLNTRKEGKLAGLTLGVAVILVYYAFFGLAEAATKGAAKTGNADVLATWARWIPNMALGALGLAALWWRTHARNGALTLPVPHWIDRLTRGRSAEPGLPTSSRPRVVVVIRIPQITIPTPRILDRYVSSRYLRLATLAFVSLLSIYYVGTFLDLSEKLFKGQANLWVFLEFLWYSTPQFVAFVIPIATLVAVLSTIGGLTRTGELTVMRACGVSLYRAALPLILIALLWGGVLFMLEEHILSQANRRAEVLEDIIRDRPSHTVNVVNLNWLAGRDGRIYYYAVFERSRRALSGLSVFETATSPYRLLSHTYASRAVYDAAGWQARNGWTQRFADDREQPTRQTFTSTALPLGPLEPLEDFQRAQVDPSQMKLGELREYVRRLGASGFNVVEQQVNLHRKVAFPFAALVMTLLAVPFGVTTGKRGALAGIGVAIVLSFAYWILMTVFVAAGGAAVLPAALAAWAANILFLAAALYLMFTVRT